MIAAYSAFATLGTRATATGIVRVENSKGDVLWEPAPVRAPVMSPEESWLMVSMMKDVIQRGTAAGSVGSQFHLPAGGKTGTTNDGTDAWFIGYTSDLVAGLWVGFDKPQPIKGNAQGGHIAAPAWTAFMNEVYRRKPSPPDWPRPEGIVVREIDPATGMLAGPGCSGSVTEYFIVGTDPVQQCMPSYGVPGVGYDSLTGQPYPMTPTPYTPTPYIPPTTTQTPYTPSSPPRRQPTTPSGTPIPRISTPADTAVTRGRIFPPRDSLRPRRDSTGPQRDSLRPPRRDTTRIPPDSNPFTIPSRP
jgi:penicillin-binding protein 1A